MGEEQQVANSVEAADAIRGTSALYIQGIVSNVIALGFTTMASRLLGQTEFGQYSAIIMFITLFATIGSLSLSIPATRFIADAHGKGEISQGRAIGSSIISVGFIMSVITAVIALLSLPLIVLILGVNLPIDFPWFLVVLDILLTCFVSYLTGTIQGYRKYSLLAISLTIISITRYGGAFLMLFLDGSFNSIVVGLAVGNTIGTILMASIAIRRVYPFKRVDSQFLRDIFVYTGPLFISLIVGQINSYMDRILLLTFMDVVLFGIYAIGIMMTMIYTLGSRALFNVAFSEQSKVWGGGERNQLNEVSSKMARFVFLLLPPITIFISSSSYALVSLLFDASYIESAIVLTLIGFTNAIFCYDIIANGYLLATGETKALLIGSAAASLIGTITGFLLIPQFGLLGATISRCITIIVLSTYPMIWLGRRSMFRFDHRFHVRTLLSALSMYIPVLFLVLVLPPIWAMAASAFIGFLLYSLFLRILGIVTTDDVKTIALLFPKRARSFIVTVGIQVYRAKEYEVPVQ